MSKYQQFIFEAYAFDAESKVLKLSYSLDGKLQFTETFRFDFATGNYDEAALDRANQILFFLAGVSYYKTYLPPQIVVKAGRIDENLAAFLSKTYQGGLGEFFYVNGMDPRTKITFPTNTDNLASLEIKPKPAGLLIGAGGGKDSLVTVEALRDHADDLMTWSLNHRPQLTPLVERIGLPHAWVERTWDQQLLELNKLDAYNGHIPISAIFAAVGAIVCILTGRRDNVVSNESSASEPNLIYKGEPINHQYSKSLEFERDFQELLRQLFNSSLRYYSFLRPLSEVKISEIFAGAGFDKYKDVFSSCNRAFTHAADHMFWCGECPKCAFTFLALTPFVERQKLEALWNGKNLLLDPALEPKYEQLLGIEGDKPLDCVGEVKEARAAMELAKKQYPELDKYRYEIPSDYDYRALGAHAMPAEIYEIFKLVIS